MEKTDRTDNDADAGDAPADVVPSSDNNGNNDVPTMKETDETIVEPIQDNNDKDADDKTNDDTAANNTGDEEMGVSPVKEVASTGELVVDSGAVADLYDLDCEFAAVRLPVDAPNGNRVVPPACAICLCPYEVGDQITHSPLEHCKHAFHYECISTWLAKKPQSHCPCCRQEFCDVSGISPTSSTDNSSSNDDEDDDDDDDDDVESGRGSAAAAAANMTRATSDGTNGSDAGNRSGS